MKKQSITAQIAEAESKARAYNAQQAQNRNAQTPIKNKKEIG